MSVRTALLATVLLMPGLFAACTPVPESSADSPLRTEAQALTTRTPGLLRDINPTTMSASPQSLMAADGRLFFTVDDTVIGRELYVSDGTLEGTRLVKDLLPGPRGSSPQRLTWMRGQLYFFAAPTEGGGNTFCDPFGFLSSPCRLWKSDGTAEGTVPVSDVQVLPRFLVERNGTLFFIGYDQARGAELWKSDGTAAGTVILKDISPNSDSSIYNLTLVNDTLLFFVPLGNGGGVDLWKSDGTEAGTLRVEPFVGNSFSYSPPSPVAMNGALYFFTSTQAQGDTLWKTDGTAAGTVLVKDPDPNVSSVSFSPLVPMPGGLLYFSAEASAQGNELWRSDGTEVGTFRLKDIFPGSGSSAPRSLTPAGSVLFFSADDGVSGRELWKTDGTVAGTVRVKDLLPGAGGSNPSDMLWLDGVLFFSASDGVQGRELWKTDGTEAGTVRVKDIHPGTYDAAPALLVRSTGQSFFFVAQDAATGRELWKSDGTEAGTRLVKDLVTRPAGSGVTGFTRMGSVSYFAADDGRSGKELWRTDGTPEGTRLVKDILPGAEGSSPRELTVVNDTLYFVVDGAVPLFSGKIHELWKSDGTEAGTMLVRSAFTNFSSPYVNDIHSLVAFNGALLFKVYDTQLWKSDGTSAGTVLLSNPNGSSTITAGWSMRPNPPALFKGSLYLELIASADGNELWKTDGSSGGTALIKDIYPGGAGSVPVLLRATADTLFFVANESSSQTSLWKSDGTQAGTLPLVPFNWTRASGSWRPQLVLANGTLFFVNKGQNSFRDELWKSNGTVAGTVRLWPPSGTESFVYPDLESLTAVGQTVFFVSAGTGVEGRELWKSDGTPEGTMMVKNIRPDPQNGGLDTVGSSPVALTEVNGQLYFAVGDGTSGEELWKSDGTAAGTVQVSDVRPGSQGSQPRAMSALGDSLLFAADGDGTGHELWVVAPASVNCPPSRRVEAISAAGAAASYESATAADGVPASKAIEYSHPSGGVFPLGETTVTVTVDDPAYAVRRCRFVVNVSDTTPPSLTCPESITRETPNPQEIITWPAATATDAVSEPQVSYSRESGSTFRPGSPAKITVTAKDAAGNESTCDFTVTLTTPSEAGCGCGASDSGAAALWLVLLLGLRLMASRRGPGLRG